MPGHFAGRSPPGVRPLSKGPESLSIVILPIGEDLSASGSALTIQLRDVLLINAIAWMPDGRDLVFTGVDRSVRHSLWRIPADGTVAPQRLAFAADVGGGLAVSGRGGSGDIRLVYARSTYDINIWRVETERRGAKMDRFDTARQERSVFTRRKRGRLRLEPHRQLRDLGLRRRWRR